MGNAFNTCDTPVNASVDNLPWTIDIDPTVTPIDSSGWSSSPNDLALLIHKGLGITGGTQNQYMAWDVVLAAGTWKIEVMHDTWSDRAIYTVQLDGASMTSFGGNADTFDGYTASQVANTLSPITGIVIPVTTKRRLKFVGATKNGSSSGYRLAVQHVRLTRTA